MSACRRSVRENAEPRIAALKSDSPPRSIPALSRRDAAWLRRTRKRGLVRHRTRGLTTTERCDKHWPNSPEPEAK